MINLIARNNIEEKILAGIRMKTDVFDGVFEGASDEVVFSSEKRMEKLNQLKEMMAYGPLTGS